MARPQASSAMPQMKDTILLCVALVDWADRFGRVQPPRRPGCGRTYHRIGARHPMVWSRTATSRVTRLFFYSHSPDALCRQPVNLWAKRFPQYH